MSLLKVNEVQNTSGNADITNVGKVLQVVNSFTSSQVTTTDSDYGSNPTNTGLSVTLTPSSSSNKVLVVIHANFAGDGCRINPLLFRGSTSNRIDFGVGNQGLMDYGLFRDGNNAFRFSFMYLDSPSSSSAVTYNLYFSKHGGSGTARFNKEGGTNQHSISTMTAMEVAA